LAEAGSRTPDEARVVAAQLRKQSVAYLTALEKNRRCRRFK